MMFKVGISGDLLNSENEPCFGNDPLEPLKNRKDVEISWMDKKIIEITPEMTSEYDAILLNLPKANAHSCLLYTSPSPRDLSTSRMPSSA